MQGTQWQPEAVHPALRPAGEGGFSGGSSSNVDHLFTTWSKRLLLVFACLSVLSLLGYFLVPVKVPGALDKDLGIVEEVNDRGSASGNCEMPDGNVGTAFKVDKSSVMSFYIGAICRWVVSTSGSMNYMEVSYAWFENGTLAREKEVNERLGFEVDSLKFQDRPAILVKTKPYIGCGMVTSFHGEKNEFTQGVIQFWVQEPDVNNYDDSCKKVQFLMRLAFGTVV